jgi:polyphosphate glucokinase
MAGTSGEHPFGIDFGGSGIKGAPVDLSSGEFAAERTRVETPSGGRPKDVAGVVAQLVQSGGAAGAPLGHTLPGGVVRGGGRSAANKDNNRICVI